MHKLVLLLLVALISANIAVRGSSSDTATDNERIRIEHERQIRQEQQARIQREQQADNRRQAEQLARLREAQDIAEADAANLAARLAAIEKRNARQREATRAAVGLEDEQQIPSHERSVMTEGAWRGVAMLQKAADEKAAAEAQALANAEKAALTTRLEAEANALAAEEEEFKRKVDAARDRIYAAYPIFAKDDSIERLALLGYSIREMENPERSEFFKDPNWPAKIAVEFARIYKIGPNGLSK